MSKMTQVHHREMSMWQSAVDQVVSKSTAGGQALGVGEQATIRRPDPADPMVAAAGAIATDVHQGTPPPPPAPVRDMATLGVADVARFCSTAAFHLAEARVRAFFSRDKTEVKKLEEEIGEQFGTCDPRWAQVIAVYVAARAADPVIPYRRHENMSDFVIDGRLPSKAKVALVADWGTGQDAARFVLRQIAEKDPDVVIHLGDVYYSGTEHEFQSYFYNIWQPTLKLPKVNWGEKPPDAPSRPATFTMTGNHDLYAGGKPYYTLIDMLGQPASYFCLRNDDWQLVAMDTGLHDSSPASGEVTFLEDSEAAWVRDKVENSGERRTILLSHHQLYSAFEHPGGKDERTNQKLLAQLGSILPRVAAWFWGHEHTLTIYKKFENVLGRCIGHGAFPVGVDEEGKADPAIPTEDVALDPDSVGGLFQHGYTMLELDGAGAQATYFVCDATRREEIQLPFVDRFV